MIQLKWRNFRDFIFPITKFIVRWRWWFIRRNWTFLRFYILHKRDTKGENQSKCERRRENKGLPSYNSYYNLIFLHPSSSLHSLSLSEFISVSTEWSHCSVNDVSPLADLARCSLKDQVMCWHVCPCMAATQMLPFVHSFKADEGSFPKNQPKLKLGSLENNNLIFTLGFRNSCEQFLHHRLFSECKTDMTALM